MMTVLPSSVAIVVSRAPCPISIMTVLITVEILASSTVPVFTPQNLCSFSSRDTSISVLPVVSKMLVMSRMAMGFLSSVLFWLVDEQVFDIFAVNPDKNDSIIFVDLKKIFIPYHAEAQT